jgi:hypothetical protein
MRGPVSRPAPKGFAKVDFLVSVALYLLKDLLGLRVALDLLDEAILLALIKRPDAAEQQRGNRYQVLRCGVIEQSAELTDVGSTYHRNSSFAGIFPQP